MINNANINGWKPLTDIEIRDLRYRVNQLGYPTEFQNLHSIESLQTNLLVNPGFETVDPTNAAVPYKWAKYKTGTTAVFEYLQTGGVSGRAVKISYPGAEVNAHAYWIQNVTVVGGTSYTLSGSMKTDAAVGQAFIQVEWYNGAGTFISVNQLNKITGTTTFTTYTGTFTAPAGAVTAHILLTLLSGGGAATFDNISFVGQQGTVPTYACVNNVCTPQTCTVGSAGCYTDSSCAGACGTGGGGACTDPLNEINVFGSCIKKKYVVYSAAGFGALFLLSLLK